MSKLRAGVSKALLMMTSGAFFAGSAWAQKPARGSTTSVRFGPQVAFVAIGDEPPPEFDYANGKRVIKDAPPSELPPISLYLKTSGSYEPVAMGRNVPGSPRPLPRMSELAVFLERSAPAPAFFKVEVPAASEDITVFLLRSPTTKDWRKEPKPVVFENGEKKFPKNSLRLINFSKVPVTFEIMAGQPIEVAAMGTSIVSIPPAEQGILMYKASIGGKEGPVRLIDTAMTYPADARIDFIAYQSDRPNPKNAVEFTMYFELPLRP